jgi:hypothetical protein
MKALCLLVLCAALACGGTITPDAPGAFDAPGLKLVIGVERSKTFVVGRDGEVVSSATGSTAMKFVGRELRIPDGSLALLSLEGDELRTNGKHIGAFDGDTLLLGDLHISVHDDGVVDMSRAGETKKMRLHFEGNVHGHRRPALMLVAVVFAIYVVTHPGATFEQFADD